MAIQCMRTGQQGLLLWDTEKKTRAAVDLFLSDHPGRLLPNVISVEGLRDVDLLFGTHDHVDHIDREAWKEAARRHPALRFAVPEHFAANLPRELEIPEDRFFFVQEDKKQEYRGISFQMVPAAHEFLDPDPDGHHPYAIYIIELGGVRICHMGDTCLYEGILGRLRELGPFDALFPPINGRDAERYRRDCIGNMTFQEAADLTGVLSPGLAVPGHYDMFADNSEDPQQFKDYVEAKYPGQAVRILSPGEIITLRP